ncbi:uncharacterized protein [Typha latifolia]|uniref:uncharacterized protein isoform X1 n=1 Tax=Typha latifolia TaxID=4733 RepID=UPI003C2DA89F
MEGVSILYSGINAIGSAQAPQEIDPNIAMPMAEPATRRKRLSDITNLTSNGRPTNVRSDPQDQEISKAIPSTNAKDYIAQLIKENSAILRLLGERNKIIELGSVELQKLRITLQKVQQQNWVLAQTNSQMLAEFNLGKEKMKALQHEVRCTATAFRAKTLELEEAKRLNKQHNKQPDEKISFDVKEENNKAIHIVSDALHPTSNKKTCNPSRKRLQRSQSFGSSTSTQEVTAKQNHNSRSRQSLRRKSSNMKVELSEPTGELFEIDDLKLPIRSLINGTVHEDSSSQIDSSMPASVPDVILNPVSKELREKSCLEMQIPRRSSLGRPLRKAAEKVSSYKEIPVNIKMRRAG